MDHWDYLLVSVPNARQAEACEQALRLRRQLGILAHVDWAEAIADPDGKRIGSGGSTIRCLMAVLKRERQSRGAATWEEILTSRRILILHAGGDSRRLPAYASCCKLFMPLPGKPIAAIPLTLFDRQLPVYLSLPPQRNGTGQIVIASGDVWLDVHADRFPATNGVTGVAFYAGEDEAALHGVFCIAAESRARCVLQKPTRKAMRAAGAVNRSGQVLLDTGLFQIDARTAVRLLQWARVSEANGVLRWNGPLAEAIECRGLDFYREIIGALGSEETVDGYLRLMGAAGSRLPEGLLEGVFHALSGIPLHVHVDNRTTFVHLGTSRELLNRGPSVCPAGWGFQGVRSPLIVQSEITDNGYVHGGRAWIEGCRIKAPVELAGENLIVGVDVEEPLLLGRGICLDVLPGRNRKGKTVQFIRVYHVDDAFGAPSSVGDERLCGIRLCEWLVAVNAQPTEVWDGSLKPEERTAWNARVFPAEQELQSYRNWLWMARPQDASLEQLRAWLLADRYSLAEMADLSSVEDFAARRLVLQREGI